MTAKRLAFAKQYEDWDKARWSKVVFSDKSTIQQFAQRKRTVCRPFGTRFNDCYTQATVKHPPNVMFWGAMSSNGTAGVFTNRSNNERRQVPQNVGGKLFAIPDAVRCCQMLEAIHECNTFMQDGASCHRSKSLRRRLSKRRIGLVTARVSIQLRICGQY